MKSIVIGHHGLATFWAGLATLWAGLATIIIVHSALSTFSKRPGHLN